MKLYGAYKEVAAFRIVYLQVEEQVFNFKNETFEAVYGFNERREFLHKKLFWMVLDFRRQSTLKKLKLVLKFFVQATRTRECLVHF